MRKLLVLLILATLLWSGYWFAGSTALRNAAEQWFADQAAQGVIAERGTLSVAGFPNRFDLTAEGIRIADPRTGMGWEAPFAQVFAMTWKPWHIIAALPPEQLIRLPDQDIALVAQGLRASLRAAPETSLPLVLAGVESGPWQARSTKGWVLGASTLAGSIGSDPGSPATYALAFEIADLAPDPAFIASLPPASTLPPEAEVIRVRLTARLSAPLDRHAAQSQPRLTGLDLAEVDLRWGTLTLGATGRIEPDETGFASGRIEIAVTNWQELIPLLVASGSVSPEVAPTVENMLRAMASEGGNPAVLNLPLTLAAGRMSLGPLPLGAAPLLVAPTN